LSEDDIFGRGLEDALEIQSRMNELDNLCYRYLQRAFDRREGICPNCGGLLVIVPIDDDRGMVYDECECGLKSEPYVIYEDPLFASLVLDDILDAEFIE
jgi:hypothetical protein